MDESVIVANEFLKIFSNKGGIFIETYKRGFPLDQLSAILSQHPEIGVTSLSILRNSIMMATGKTEKFGEYKDKISIELTEYDTVAAVVFNMSEEELGIAAREKLVKDLLVQLNSKGIVHGIKTEFLTGELKSGIRYIIAEGSMPIDGTDATVRMYELQEAKPKVNDDDRVDYYELMLINRVSSGDWLGERVEATDGIPGITVKGTTIKPVKGKSALLDYDKNTVQEIYINGKTTLYARINGAVNYTNGKLGVSNHLEIDGDVGISTGNIKFDGYITVKGTVSDGFSVEATKDIEINSPLGLGSVKSLVTTDGSIFIRGGISPKSRVKVKAAKNIFVKFADNADIVCGGIAHIGYYSLNSEVTAKEVVFDASNGQIIGGRIKAEIKVNVPIIGSEAERRTFVEVTGFNRQALLENMDSIFRSISDLKNEQQKQKQLQASFDSVSRLDQFKRKEYNDISDRLFAIRNDLRKLEEDRRNYTEYLKARGEGEVAATKRIYPKACIIIKGNSIEITEPMPPTVFFSQDSELRKL